MSNQNRIRKSRRIKSTHFVDEVVMCALNDPLPPYHPQTPPSPDYQVCKNIFGYLGVGHYIKIEN